MSSREGILIQSRRLVNNRRWAAAYRAGRPTSLATLHVDPAPRQVAEASVRDRGAAGIVVIELASHARPARP